MTDKKNPAYGLGPMVPTGKPPQYYANPPQQCDICSAAFGSVMYDAPTRSGPWANMCHPCWSTQGRSRKLGVGLGQKYRRQKDQRWLKVEG